MAREIATAYIKLMPSTAGIKGMLSSALAGAGAAAGIVSGNAVVNSITGKVNTGLKNYKFPDLGSQVNAAFASANPLPLLTGSVSASKISLQSLGTTAANTAKTVASKVGSLGLKTIKFMGASTAVIGAGVIAASTAVTAAVGKFVVSSVQTGMAFDQSMAQVAATMGTTVDQIGELRDFALEMGSTTAFSATEAAEALNYMALAGYDSTQAMEALPNVLNLAAAGGIDLASASDMVTDAQSALGLSMDESAELVDKMAQTASKSNTSVAQLGEAILTIGATAKGMAGGTTELSTALGILADNGIKGAEGGTHLRNIILSLQSPTDAAADALNDLGVAVYDADGNMRGLDDVLGDLNAGMDDLTSAEKDNIISTIFNKTDLASVNALLANTGDRWDELSGYIDNAAGAAEQMANTQLDNLSGDITLFKSALEGAKIVVSDELTPTLRSFVQMGTEWVGELTTAFQEDGLAGAADALDRILSEDIAPIIETELPALLESILPLVLNTGVNIVMSLINGIIAALPTLVEQVPQIIINIVDTLSANLPQIGAMAGQIIATLVVGLVSNFQNLAESVVQLGVAIVQGVWAGIKSMWSTFWANVSGFFSGIVNGVKSLLGIASPSKVFRAIGGFTMEGLSEGIAGGQDMVQASMRSAVSGALDEAKQLTVGANMRVSAVSSGVRSSDAGNDLQELVAALREDVKNMRIYLDGRVIAGYVDTALAQRSAAAGRGVVYA